MRRGGERQRHHGEPQREWEQRERERQREQREWEQQQRERDGRGGSVVELGDERHGWEARVHDGERVRGAGGAVRFAGDGDVQGGEVRGGVHGGGCAFAGVRELPEESLRQHGQRVVARGQHGNVYDDGNPCDQYTCTIAGTPQYTPRAGLPCMSTGICELNPDMSNQNLAVCFACDPTSASACTPGFTVCVGGACVPSHCADHMQNTGESDVDCGGPCPHCQVGQKCSVYSDCYSQFCEAPDGGQSTCQAPACPDGRQNGTETDVDCGGGQNTCPRCGNTLKCLKPTDCQSGVCLPTGIMGSGMPNTCQAPTCNDGVKNGNETGTDCGGGGGCPPCGDGGT